MEEDNWMHEEVLETLDTCITEARVLRKSLEHYESQIRALTKAKNCIHRLKDLSDPFMVRVQCTKCLHTWSY